MDPKEWELVGVLTKINGKYGELLLKIKKDFPDSFGMEQPVFIPVERADEGLPFYLEHCQRIRNSQYSVRFDLVDDGTRASGLLGLGVWLPSSAYPEEKREERLLERVQGFRVIDRQEGDLGVIEGGIDRSEQPVAHVGKDRTPIPLTDAFVKRVDEEERILYMDLPDGILDL